MKLIRTGHHERTQSHSSSASIDEESVASFQNEPPLNQRNVEDQGRKYRGGRVNPPAVENFVFFAQKNEKNCAFESILVTNSYERTCYAPLLTDLEILAVGAPPPALETELRPC